MTALLQTAVISKSCVFIKRHQVNLMLHRTVYTKHGISYLPQSNFLAILYNNLSSNNLSHGDDAIYNAYLCILRSR